MAAEKSKSKALPSVDKDAISPFTPVAIPSFAPIKRTGFWGRLRSFFFGDDSVKKQEKIHTAMVAMIKMTNAMKSSTDKNKIRYAGIKQVYDDFEKACGYFGGTRYKPKAKDSEGRGLARTLGRILEGPPFKTEKDQTSAKPPLTPETIDENRTKEYLRRFQSYIEGFSQQITIRYSQDETEERDEQLKIDEAKTRARLQAEAAKALTHLVEVLNPQMPLYNQTIDHQIIVAYTQFRKAFNALKAQEEKEVAFENLTQVRAELASYLEGDFTADIQKALTALDARIAEQQKREALANLVKTDYQQSPAKQALIKLEEAHPTLNPEEKARYYKAGESNEPGAALPPLSADNDPEKYLQACAEEFSQQQKTLLTVLATLGVQIEELQYTVSTKRNGQTDWVVTEQAKIKHVHATTIKALEALKARFIQEGDLVSISSVDSLLREYKSIPDDLEKAVDKLREIRLREQRLAIQLDTAARTFYHSIRDALGKASKAAEIGKNPGGAASQEQEIAGFFMAIIESMPFCNGLVSAIIQEGIDSALGDYEEQRLNNLAKWASVLSNEQGMHEFALRLTLAYQKQLTEQVDIVVDELAQDGLQKDIAEKEAEIKADGERIKKIEETLPKVRGQAKQEAEKAWELTKKEAKQQAVKARKLIDDKLALLAKPATKQDAKQLAKLQKQDEFSLQYANLDQEKVENLQKIRQMKIDLDVATQSNEKSKKKGLQKAIKKLEEVNKGLDKKMLSLQHRLAKNAPELANVRAAIQANVILFINELLDGDPAEGLTKLSAAKLEELGISINKDLKNEVMAYLQQRQQIAEHEQRGIQIKGHAPVESLLKELRALKEKTPKDQEKLQELRTKFNGAKERIAAMEQQQKREFGEDRAADLKGSAYLGGRVVQAFKKVAQKVGDIKDKGSEIIAKLTTPKQPQDREKVAESVGAAQAARVAGRLLKAMGHDLEHEETIGRDQANQEADLSRLMARALESQSEGPTQLDKRPSPDLNQLLFGREIQLRKEDAKAAVSAAPPIQIVEGHFSGSPERPSAAIITNAGSFKPPPESPRPVAQPATEQQPENKPSSRSRKGSSAS